MKTLKMLFVIVAIMLILAFFNTNIAQVNLQNGLIAYYPFNGNAIDESGNGYNGTVNGAILTSDRFGRPNRAYRFSNGTNIDCGNPADKVFDFAGDFSISVWVQFDEIINGKDNVFLGKDEGPYNLNKWLFFYSAGWGTNFTTGFLIDSPTGLSDYSIKSSQWFPELSKWYNIIITKNGTTYSLYKDGVKNGTVNSTYKIPDIASNLKIGYGEQGGFNFNGAIDDVRIYNRALNEQEIQALYREDTSGLIGYWPFNGNANDESGNGNNGIVNGASLTFDRFGNPNSAYYFNGTSDYINMGNHPSLNLDTAVTMSVWIKFSSSYPSNSNGFTGIITKRLSYILQLNDPHGLAVTIYNGSSFPGFWRDTTFQNDFAPNQWYHLVGIYREQTGKGCIYINGVERGVIARNDNGWPSSLNSSSSELTIGNEQDYGCWFKGAIDDVRIYNRGLNKQEIQVLYNEPPSPSIFTFTPTSGTKGATVAIKGKNFTGATAVSFGGVAAASYTVVSDTSITATIASGASGSVSVTNHERTATLAGFIFTLPPRPAITSFAPTSGTVGTAVIITGTNFNTIPANNVVFFGATQATVTASSATSLTVIVPAGATYKPISVTDITTGLVGYATQPFMPVFAGGPAFDANSFAPKVDYTFGTDPVFVTIGDLDGDGKPDLAFSNHSFRTIVSIFRNTSTNGTFSFGNQVDLSSGIDPFGIFFGDLDGDGKPDLAIANEGSNTVSVFRNTSTIGTISFADKVDFNTGKNPQVVSVGDFDGDGKLDLAVPNYDDNTISVFKNTSTIGSISFADKVDFATGTTPWSIAVGDLDSDGKPDLAVANFNSNTVSIFKNTSTIGSISFAEKTDYITGQKPIDVVIADLEGDGKPDLAVSNYNDNTVSVLKNTSSIGNISFTQKIDFATGSSPWCISMENLDGDDKPDLTVANHNSNTVSVLRNTSTNGAISFAPKVDFATGDRPIDVSIGDLNNDGKPDLVVTNQFAYTVSVIKNTIMPWDSIPIITSFTPTSGAVGTTVTITGTNFNTMPVNNVVFFGATQAVVSAASATSLTVTVPAGATYKPISVTDITTGLTGYASRPFITTFNGGAAFNASSFAAKVDFTAGTNPTSVSINDLDGDGKPDLAVVNSKSNTVSVFRNTGTSDSVSFADKMDYTTGIIPTNISVGDLDGDGKPDLVVTSTGKVSVFRNTSTIGSISFASRVDYTAGSLPVSVAIGDLDGDGRPDLAVANSKFNTVSVFKNTSTNGIISFADKVDYIAGQGPVSVAIGDLDNDGKLELAVANVVGIVSIFRNISTKGSISFIPNLYLTTETGLCSVSMGDLDGDGKLDLAVINAVANTVSVYRNTSTSSVISFAAKVDYITGTDPASVFIDDLDGDGKPDLTIVNNGSSTVSVYKNMCSTGIVSFADQVDYATGLRPAIVSVGDLDGDGKPDIAVANYYSNTLSVLRNTIMPPPTIVFLVPTSGVVGTMVTITGTNFTGATSVNLGSKVASYTVVSDTTIIATVTAGTSGSISITTPFGTTISKYTITCVADNFSITSVTGVNNITADVPSIYPNPTNGMITLDISEGNVTISDLNGKTLLNKALGKDKTIEIANFASGMYILMLRTKDAIYEYKILKQ